jgi:hypothetical protein
MPSEPRRCQYLIGIPWNRNSCWLDASLEAMSGAMQDSLQSLRMKLRQNRASSGHSSIYSVIDYIIGRDQFRSHLGTNLALRNYLESGRDRIRELLYRDGIINSVGGYESATVRPSAGPKRILTSMSRLGSHISSQEVSNHATVPCRKFSSHPSCTLVFVAALINSHRMLRYAERSPRVS